MDEKIIAGIEKLWLVPKSSKEKLKDIIQSEGDALQASLDSAIKNGGVDAVNKIFDLSQAVLISRVDDI